MYPADATFRRERASGSRPVHPPQSRRPGVAGAGRSSFRNWNSVDRGCAVAGLKVLPRERNYYVYIMRVIERASNSRQRMPSPYDTVCRIPRRLFSSRSPTRLEIMIPCMTKASSFAASHAPSARRHREPPGSRKLSLSERTSRSRSPVRATPRENGPNVPPSRQYRGSWILVSNPG
jgi:hypothetical protein